MSNIKVFSIENELMSSSDISLSENSHTYYDAEGNKWLPFRTLLETIGAVVTWNNNKREIGIRYSNEEYFAILDDYNEKEYNFFAVVEPKYYGSSWDGLYLQLSQWSSSGLYIMVDNRTYVDDVAMIRLLYYLGYYLDIDNNKLIKVSKNSDKLYWDKYKEILERPVNEEAETLLNSVFNIFYVDIVDYDVQRIGDKFRINIDFQCHDKDNIFQWDDWEPASLTERNIVLSKIDDTLIPDLSNIKVYKNSKTYNALYLIQCDDFYIAYGDISIKVFE